MRKGRGLLQVWGAVLLAAAVLAAQESRSEWPVLRTYSGEYLRRIKMPLGGVGTGTISLAGRGALVDWEIRSTPAKGITPFDLISPCFLVRTETPDGHVEARLLEGPLDTSHYEGALGPGPHLNHGFPRFSDCSFKVAYPLAQVALSDPGVPVSAVLEAMNPMILNDAEASGIPAVLLRWRLVNRLEMPLKVSLCGVMVNPCGGRHVRELLDANGLKGVRFASADTACRDDLGEFAFAVAESAGAVTRAISIADCGWQVGFDPFWRAFVASGRAQDLKVAGRNPKSLAATSVEVTLEPGAEKEVPFVLAWRFPHRHAWKFPNSPKSKRVGIGYDPKEDVGNYYATRFPSARAAMEDLFSGLSGYEAETVRFVKSVLSSKAPDVVKEAALFNLSTLRTETCFRTADGHFFGWEGCHDRVGSCWGSCTHVWGYEHALIDIWPALAKDMTELQFGPASVESGHMSMRIGLPLATHARSAIDAADGHSQSIVKAYENWRKTGDDAWMKRLYPKIRRAMEFCWIKGGWDPDCNGVMEGCQHNTMDVEYYGPNPQMEFLYLAALKATAAMADAAGDGDFARKCRDLAKRGSDWTEKNLFNGEYYEHKVVPHKGEIAEGLRHPNMGARNLAKPEYQLACGCLVDQLVGDYAARVVGLGPVADERNAEKTLDTILRHNRRGSSDFNHMRTFAFPEERSLTMGWYPKGRMPESPFPYYFETMTGFEYVVAAGLAQRGRYGEAEAVVRDIRARYDGKKRNPFDEAECGHHYARAMAAWTVLKAWK